MNKYSYVKYNFENLEVYELANELVMEVYKTSRTFPKEELFGPTSQLRRASVSVVLNIAEGSARGSKKEFIRFLNHAIGSLFETKAAIILGVKLGYCREEKVDTLIKMIDRLFFKLSAFKKSLAEK